MEAGEYDIGPLLPFCAECGDELILSRSGHQFCANHRCRDGFDVRPDWRFDVARATRLMLAKSSQEFLKTSMKRRHR